MGQVLSVGLADFCLFLGGLVPAALGKDKVVNQPVYYGSDHCVEQDPKPNGLFTVTFAVSFFGSFFHTDILARTKKGVSLDRPTPQTAYR